MVIYGELLDPRVTSIDQSQQVGFPGLKFEHRSACTAMALCVMGEIAFEWHFPIGEIVVHG